MKYKAQSTDSALVVDLPVALSLDTQAAVWMVRLEAENPSVQDVLEFKQWLQKSAAHRDAFEEMMLFWNDMNILTQAVLPSELAVDHREGREVGHSTLFNWFRVHSRASAAFTLVMVVAILFTVTQFYNSDPMVYVTGIGEQKTIELEDGSTVMLNTNSRLEVSYSDELRQLKLVQGEVYFDVFHNPDRPFEVWAGKGLVRAIGTAFVVHIRKVDIEVIVTEGIVEFEEIEPTQKNVKVVDSGVSSSDVTALSQSQGEPFKVGIQVKAGSKLVYDPEELEKIKLAVVKQIEKDLSWQQGLLVFSAEPLSKVVEEVSRYTDLKIVILEPKARELLVSGVFRVGDTESLFEALKEGFDLHVEQALNNRVYLIADDNK